MGNSSTKRDNNSTPLPANLPRELRYREPRPPPTPPPLNTAIIPNYDSSTDAFCDTSGIFGVADLNGDGRDDIYCHDLSGGNTTARFIQEDLIVTGTAVNCSAPSLSPSWSFGPVQSVLKGWCGANLRFGSRR